MKSGIYGFIQTTFNVKSGKLIFTITVGKTTNKDRRQGEYRIANANNSFIFFTPMPPESLAKAETELIRALSVKYPKWGGANEQFRIGEISGDLSSGAVIIENLTTFIKEEGLILESKDKDNFNYNGKDQRKDVFGDYNDPNFGRQPCSVFPGAFAALTGTSQEQQQHQRNHGKAKFRFIFLNFVAKGGTMEFYEEPKQIYLSDAAYRFFRMLFYQNKFDRGEEVNVPGCVKQKNLYERSQ